MHKSFKLIMALIIGLFTVPMLGSTVFADESYDNIADGEYDIGVTALEDGEDKESIANDFVHDATLTIEDGNPSLTIGVGADGGGAYANFDFSIDWVNVEGKEPISDKDEGDFIYYTFELNNLDSKVPAEMKYVVPDFPPLADGHEVDFDLKLEGLDDLPKKGKVEVTYVNQNGEKIADSEKLEGKIGSDYKADQKNIYGYNFEEVNGDREGEYAKETTTVEFVYKEKEQSEVTVTYVDQDGNKVADPETLEDYIGSDYKTEQKEIDGYNFVEVNGDETGEYTKKTTTVEYVYEEVEHGEVTVTYVDQEGKEIADPKTLEGEIGTSYSVEQETIDGYNVVEIKGNEKGEFSEETTTVEYLYEKEAPEERVVGDLLTGDEADSVYELEYETGSKATAMQLENPVKLLKKNNNEYIQIPINEDGAQFFRSLKVNGEEVTWNSITEAPYTVQFKLPNGIEDELDLSMVIQAGPRVMSHDDIKLWFDENSLETIKEPEDSEKPEEQGEVTVTYVDQNGEEIAEPKTLEGDIGSAYEAKQKDVDGYDFVEVNGEEEGKYTEESTTVEFVYEEQKKDPGKDPEDPEAPEKPEQGKVKVTYIDQDGNKVADPKTLKGDIGDTYEAKQKDVDGYDFVKVKGEEKGDFVEETTSVEYVYEKEEQKEGTGKELEKQKEETGSGVGKAENGVDGEVNPQTGETSNIMLYSLLLIGSGIPLAFITRRRFAKS